MPPRKKDSTSNRSRQNARKDSGRGRSGKSGRSSRTGVASWIVFWPFHLLHRLSRRFSWPVRWGLRLVGYPAIAGSLGLAALALVYGLRAQPYDLAKVRAMPERSIIYDRLGKEIGRIHGEKREIVPLHQVSEYFFKAILAREDERFYQHHAIDPVGMARAALMNLSGKTQGASTITQQLSSDIYGLKRGENRRNKLALIDRKFLEIAIAFRIEAAFTKDEILEAYINQINWGRQIKGVAEASRIYFEKHPAELNLPEAALLAGIVRGPDAYNPFRSIDAARRERNTTLDRMVKAGAITQSEAETAKQAPIAVRPVSRRRSNESYAMNAIRRDLEIILENEDIQLGGLDITTTIDVRIQQKAEQALDARLTDVEKIRGYPHPTRAAWQTAKHEPDDEPKYLQGAVVVLENQSGGVLAVVGGRDVQESRFNRAKDGKRQIGSIFKPFVYLAAFDKGLQPDAPISDGPLLRGEIRKAGNWNPDNSDGTFGGMFPASYGLIRSRNTMSIRVGDMAGIPRVQFVAKTAGFQNEVPPVPASFLGTWEASPWEVATAYSIFPNEGTRYRPYLISEIKDADGNVLYSTLPLSYQAATRSSTREVSKILQEVAIRGTAASVQRLGFTKPCAGKTGTTNDFKDAWFAGYTSQLTCAVWVGLDQPKRTIHGGYGSVLALPVWAEIMKTADGLGYKAGRMHQHSGLIPVETCRLSGKRATSGCSFASTTQTQWMPPDTVLAADDQCPLHPARAVAIDAQTGEAIPLKAKPVEEPPAHDPPQAIPRAVPVPH